MTVFERICAKDKNATSENISTYCGFVKRASQESVLII